YESTAIHVVEHDKTAADTLLKIIDDIREKHPTAAQGDFALIFVDKANYIYDAISEVKRKIIEKYGWDVNVSFETKVNDAEKLFISNLNNAKGLEFPFVICYASNLNRNPSFRNAVYTMMARSFLESHLVLGKGVDNALVNSLQHGLKDMLQRGFMDLRIPS